MSSLCRNLFRESSAKAKEKIIPMSVDPNSPLPVSFGASECSDLMNKADIGTGHILVGEGHIVPTDCPEAPILSSWLPRTEGTPLPL